MKEINKTKIAKVFLVLLLITVVGFLLYSSIESVYQQNRCENRGFSWFSTVGGDSPYLSNSLKKSILNHTKDHYREFYNFGICADMRSK